MKTKHILWLMGAIFTLFLAGSCSGGGGSEEIPTPPPTPSPSPSPSPTPPAEKDSVIVTTDSIQASVEGGEVQISFTTNKAWTASSNQSWCTLSATSGEKGSASITIKLAENTTFSDRTAQITIKAGTATQTVRLTQPAAKRDKLEMAATSFTVTAEGKDIQIPFNTDVAWEVECDQTWCTLSATTGEAGNQSITVTVAKNKEKTERKATLTFQAGTAQPQTVTITQEAAGPDEIAIDTQTFQAETAGGSFQFSFSTNADWMIASDQSWCTLSAATGEEGSHTLTVTVEPNKDLEDRTAQITIKAGTAQETVTVTQERKYQLKVDYPDTPVDYVGATIEVKVQCNTDFEVSIGATWLRQVKSSSRSMNEQTLRFEVDANETETGREAEIIFFNEAKGLKQTIVIKQEAKPEDTSVKPGGNIGNMTWG